MKSNIGNGLPGKKAHLQMSFKSRRLEYSIPKNARKAGVMILIYPGEKSINIVFIRRTSIEGDVHKGQISFPGGGLEFQDGKNLLNTAIRETREEIGIEIPNENILGALTPLYIPVSNYEVFPYVGFLNKKPDFVIQTAELEGVIEVSLSYIMNPKIIKYKDMKVQKDFVLEGVPYYNLHGQVLWGATAMITSEFLRLL